MGGSVIYDDWELASSSNEVRTVVLVGRTGNGKSATGNSILRKRAFKSMSSSAGVTSTCELQRTVLEDGQILNVIDTPGLFDFKAEHEFIGKEIVKCINMAKDGIHAVLVVLSVRSRFSKEEEDAIQSLQKLFGSKISDYMIVVFTGGDDLEENEETLDDYLGRDCPEPLKETLKRCGNRRALFDNKTKDETKRFQQLDQLLSLVNEVVGNNGGKPYTDEFFVELKEGANKLHNQTTEVNSLEGYTKQEIKELTDQFHTSYEEQLKRITAMVESKLKEATHRLEQQLAEEQTARLKAEATAQAAQKKSNDEICKLRENLEKAQRETEELRKRAAVLIVNISGTTTTPLAKKMKVHPTSASLILLPDGRHLAYLEQGVPADKARYSIIVPHSFLSSRLAGIPGVKSSLLQEFGIRLVSYDLPGFGESDPHQDRNLESSSLDMLHLSNALNIMGKFWIVGYSDGSKHAWAALHYIPDRLAGAIMVAPMVNPYESRLTKEEKRRIWARWTVKKKLMYLLARKLPKLLPYFYHKSFLSGDHGPVDKWLTFSVGKRDKVLIEDRKFQELWERDVEESVRQGNAKPFVEEAVLQVSDWGFSIADLKVEDKHKSRGILGWLKSVYSPAETRSTGFPGPVHIWQGSEDSVVPPSMSDFVHRVLPDVTLHKLPYEGHFTFFYLCDECHRQMFNIVFGNPQEDQASTEDDEVESNEASIIDKESVSILP